jgi:hypothetical protein
MPLHTYEINPVNILTSYMPEAATSALAFMQAFYPPIPVQIEEDPSDALANGTLIGYPQGWQYPLVETFTPNDPYSIFISGADNCLSGDVQRNMVLSRRSDEVTYNETLALYERIGTRFLPARLNFSDMNFETAWQIYDAIDYLVRHDPEVAAAFAPGGQFYGDLAWLADLASEQMWSLYGGYNSSKGVGSNYLTTAGSTLAGAVWMYFTQMLESEGEVQKLNLIIADFQPIISMLALMGMGNVADDYRVLPPYATSIVFELFTYDDPSTVTEMPPASEMFVRFYFRNGSAPGTRPQFWALPMFGNGPSQTDMSWPDFSMAIQKVAFIDPLDWCNVCDASSTSAWCAGYLSWVEPTVGGEGGGKKTVSAPVAGVIGALVTLAVAGIIFALGALFCGFRIHKRSGKGTYKEWYTAKSNLGGYKGSSKMASDADLNIPRNAAPLGVGAVIDDKDIEAKRPAVRGHERVGSWELNTGNDVSNHQSFRSVGSTIVGAEVRSSFDADEDHFINVQPVRPRTNF